MYPYQVSLEEVFLELTGTATEARPGMAALAGGVSQDQARVATEISNTRK